MESFELSNKQPLPDEIRYNEFHMQLEAARRSFAETHANDLATLALAGIGAAAITPDYSPNLKQHEIVEYAPEASTVGSLALIHTVEIPSAFDKPNSANEALYFAEHKDYQLAA